MTDRIKELRAILPVPMQEALQMLKANDGDVEKCVRLFKAKSIKEISELTGCDEKTVADYYEAEKYDFNRTISSIREDTYDKNYEKVDGLTKEAISNVLQWIHIIESDDFGVSLDYQLLDKALHTLVLIPTLSEVGATVEKAKHSKDVIFEGYQDTDSLDEFVRRHRKLDDSQEFQRASELVAMKLTVMKEELLRHSRNL